MMNNNLSFSKPAPTNWVISIQGMLKVEDVAHTAISVHKVPQIVRAMKPDAYTPQFIGLGPYHHWRDSLYEMEQCKLIVAKNSKKTSSQDDQEAVTKLEYLVQCLKYSIGQIRACYDRHLEMDESSLTWMMVIDAIFLLQFLMVFISPNESCLSMSPRTNYLVDQYQSAYHSILRDIIKLENQIPIFILDKILTDCEIDISNQASLDKMLYAACAKLTPFNCDNKRNKLRRDVRNYSHLLDLLYYWIVCEDKLKYQDQCEDDHEEGVTDKNYDTLPKKWLLDIKISPPKFEGVGNIQLLNGITYYKPLKAIGKMAGLVGRVFPSIGSFSSLNMSTDSGNNGNSSSDKESKEGALKVEEIEIPSVTSLLKAGINFCPTDDDVLTSVRFDKKTRTFHLPVITIDSNTEVIIRNLVAYEAEAISGPSALARYTELMNGIIDTPEDVRLLRQKNIIVSYLKNDENVAQLWNGMSRSIRLTHVKTMDKAIKEVNEYYNNKMKVKFMRFTKECMLCAWKILMLLLALILMVLISIQSFCDVYACPGLLRPVTAKAKSS